MSEYTRMVLLENDELLKKVNQSGGAKEVFSNIYKFFFKTRHSAMQKLLLRGCSIVKTWIQRYTLVNRFCAK